VFIRQQLVGKMLGLGALRWNNGPSAFKLNQKKWICLFDAENKNKPESWHDNLFAKGGK